MHGGDSMRFWGQQVGRRVRMSSCFTSGGCFHGLSVLHVLLYKAWQRKVYVIGCLSV